MLIFETIYTSTKWSVKKTTRHLRTHLLQLLLGGGEAQVLVVRHHSQGVSTPVRGEYRECHHSQGVCTPVRGEYRECHHSQGVCTMYTCSTENVLKQSYSRSVLLHL